LFASGRTSSASSTGSYDDPRKPNSYGVFVLSWRESKAAKDADYCAEHSEFYPGCPMCQDGAGDPVESQIRFLIAKEQKHGKLEQAEQNLLNRLIKEGQKMRGVKDTAGHGPGDRRVRLHRALDKVLNAKMGGPKRQAMDWK